MTIQKARKTLGKKAEKLSDNQILDILNMLRFLCKNTTDQVIIQKDKNNSNLHY